jgi:hypothetical protein
MACATDKERERLQPPLDLSIEMFHKILVDFSRAGIKINNFDFSGHGEPLLNPHLWELTSMARSFYPDSFIKVLTNGHGVFDSATLNSGVDEIQVAIDGVDQESYSQYRMGGCFQKAWKFISDLSSESQSRNQPNVIWTYILFDHNDNPEQLTSACRMATEASISEIRFVLTSFGNWSLDIPDADSLKARLLSAGFPESNLRVDRQSSYQKRKIWSERLRRLPLLFHMIRQLWRWTRSTRKNGFPVVTADYCKVDTDRLMSFLELGLYHARSGRYDDTRDMLNHVEKLVMNPARFNTCYNPEEKLKELGNLYSSLRNASGSMQKGS